MVIILLIAIAVLVIVIFIFFVYAKGPSVRFGGSFKEEVRRQKSARAEHELESDEGKK